MQLTVRQLLDYHAGCQDKVIDAWDRASLIATSVENLHASYVNAHREKGKPRVQGLKPLDLNPHRQPKRRVAMTPESFRQLRGALGAMREAK